MVAPPVIAIPVFKPPILIPHVKGLPCVVCCLLGPEDKSFLTIWVTLSIVLFGIACGNLVLKPCVGSVLVFPNWETGDKVGLLIFFTIGSAGLNIEVVLLYWVVVLGINIFGCLAKFVLKVLPAW